MIPINGSTIHVWIDGVSIGRPVYNNYREDIASLFPGYANSDGAVGYFYFDTTAYQNGVHTIYWTATDSGGNTDGIGSRYFTVQNDAQSADVLTPKLFSGFAAEEVCPDENGVITVEIKELEPVEVHLSPGVMNVSVLPIGSTLDKERGVFYWSPGPGFIGKYRFVFVETDETGQVSRKDIIVNIAPKFHADRN
jgi:hypothetical protein